MARYNEILVGRYNRALQKMLGMKGEPPAPQLSTEITTNFQFPLGAEFRYLESWDLYGGFTNQAALAANNSGMRLRNPPNSGVILVVQKISCSVSVASLLAVGLAATIVDGGTIASTIRNLDARTLNQLGAGILSQANNFSALGIFWNLNLTAVNQEYEVLPDSGHEIPILPGAALSINTGTVNDQLIVNLMWRQRVLEESERA